ncbi:MFS transporter [Bacillus sp. Marseille-P3661]|uniref:MFS transporter n=1 Tax=Bacillus sp. Marseille-P3661 TaxID=1936234 RepID=UPI000C84E4FC|nr:MFS transporter [Bacillus sp. Marseille-P3661]
MNHNLLYFTCIISVLTPISAVRPMTSLFAKDLGASMLEIGILTACYSLTPFLFAILIGQLVDRFGEKVPLMIGAAGMTFALSLPFFHPVLFVLYISQFILGGSQLLALIALQNGVSGSVSIEKRDKALFTLSLCMSIGLMLGPIIGGYATVHLGFKNSYLLYALISIIPCIVGLFITQSNHKKNTSQNKQVHRMKDLLAIPGLMRTIFVSMLILASLDLFFVYYPLYGSSIGMSPTEIGWVLMVQSLASIIVRLFMPAIIEKYGKVKTLSTFMFCGALAYGFIPFFDIFFYIVLLSLILGTGTGIVSPLTLSLTVHLAPQERRGEILGIRMAGNRLSQVIIPLLFAGVSNFTGLGAIFTIEAIILGLGAMMASGIKIETGNENKEG